MDTNRVDAKGKSEKRRMKERASEVAPSHVVRKGVSDNNTLERSHKFAVASTVVFLKKQSTSWIQHIPEL